MVRKEVLRVSPVVNPPWAPELLALDTPTEGGVFCRRALISFT